MAVLLDHGVSVDAADPDGKTALWLAAATGEGGGVVGGIAQLLFICARMCTRRLFSVCDVSVSRRR